MASSESPDLRPRVSTARPRPSPGVRALPFALLLLAAGSGGVSGQAGAREAWTAGRDSAAIEEAVREAAEDFERYRRHRFPLTRVGSGRCDERVGRYCLVHGDDDWEPPPEQPEVGARRQALLERLEGAAGALPGSRVIAGRRVWYLLEAGRTEAAVVAARECRAGAGWCGLLQGLALHGDGRFAAAEDAFDRALEALPDAEAGALASPEVLLQGEARDRWEAADAAERADLKARLWWLADPLWLVPGSERRTEHLARRVQALIHEGVEGPYGRRWDRGLEELLLRYGWPVGWERERVPPYRPAPRESVVAHHGPHAPAVVPGPGVLVDPTDGEPRGWDLYPDEPRSTYLPAYLDTLGVPAAQRIVRFDRPDTLVVVAAWRTGWDAGAEQETETGGEPELEAAVSGRDAVEVLLRADAGPGRVLGGTAGAVGREGGRLTMAVPARGATVGPRGTGPKGETVVSLEVLDRRGRRAARVRRGLPAAARPEGLPAISDLLVLDPGALGVEPDAPPVPSEAMARARLPGPAAPGERIGLYWELYGPARRLRDAKLELELERRDGGLLRKLAEGLGLADREVRRVAAGWRFAAEPGRRVHPSGLVLTLPEELEEGDYRLRVTVTVPGYEPLPAELLLEVEAP